MMNNLLRFVLVLFLVNLAAAAILAEVYTVTRPKIEAQKKMAEAKALKEAMPESVGNRLEKVEDGDVEYWKVFKDENYRPSGYVFIAKKYGYSSVIETMVGMKRDGSITGARILNQNETPGLGAKIVEILSDKTLKSALKGLLSRKKEPEKKILPYFTEQFKGANVKNIDISDIDAITGATISSKAVVESIREKGSEILNAEQ
ncbi:MAG: FMN-binding protein [Candidatus Omnitrophica bacterium]|nr:FMN-binding protein [Candidatus Omnitrophota bacterium]